MAHRYIRYVRYIRYTATTRRPPGSSSYLRYIRYIRYIRYSHDEASSRLLLLPNGTAHHNASELTLEVVVPMLDTLVSISGGDGPPARGIVLEGLVFAHTRRTLLRRYTVPSPGDWSVYAGGAVRVEHAEAVQITRCVFNRTGGNAVRHVCNVCNVCDVGKVSNVRYITRPEATRCVANQTEDPPSRVTAVTYV